MEFFEKAHVANRKHISKDDKSKAITKKQLKQMLYGYKTSDNQVIKKSESIKPDFEDSSSVSGFSDLNLSINSLEENVDSVKKDSSSEKSVSAENDEIKKNMSNFIVKTNIRKDIKVEHTNKNSFFDTDFNVSTSLIDKKSSSSSSIIDMSHDGTSADFDPDGQLAALIQNKIQNETRLSNHKNEISSTCGTKSSSTSSILDNISDDALSDDLDFSHQLVESSHNKIKNKSKDLDPQSKSLLSICTDSSSNSSLLDILSDIDVSDHFDTDGHLASVIHNNIKSKKIEKHLKSKSARCKTKHLVTINNPCESDNQNYVSISCTQPLSPPFVSITAEDMSPQTFSGVLGVYKYPTSRILSADYHCEEVQSDTDFIPEDSMSVDINMEDEVGSLIPEVDEDLTVEDIDVSLTVEPSVQVIDESIVNEELNLDEEIKDIHVTDITDDASVNFNFYYSTTGCVIVMKHYSELYIHGKVRLKALGGNVEVFGYKLDNEYHEIYAPYCNFAQSIKTIGNNNVYYGLFGKLTATGLSVADAENIVTSVGTNDAVVYMEQYKSKQIDFIQNHFERANLFDSSYKIKGHINKASNILGCSLYLQRPQCYFVEHPSWEEAILCTKSTQSRGIVCGGKGIGKSTYLRYQVNKLLEKGPVLVVDLDPGQCEFTVAGNISATIVRTPLLGPNYTHLKKPEITLNIGMISVMDNVKRYVQAVKTLISDSFKNKEFVNMPWIVNTMGMTNSLGSKFMILIILLTKPTYILQYNSLTAKKCYETDFDASNVMWLYEKYKNDWIFRNLKHPYRLNYTFINAHDPGKKGRSNFSLSPKETRYLNFLAYFSKIVSNIDNDNILAAIPYQVPLKQLNIFTNVKVKEQVTAKVINGKVVALCQHTQRGDNAGVFTLADNALSCYGHGLIRGIDWEKEMLYVITPLSIQELNLVNALVYADWAPDITSLEAIPVGTVIPYCTKAQERHKHLMFSPRRRFNPLQLLKMTRKT